MLYGTNKVFLDSFLIRVFCDHYDNHPLYDDSIHKSDVANRVNILVKTESRHKAGFVKSYAYWFKYGRPCNYF